MKSSLRVSEERAGEVGPEASLFGVPPNEGLRVYSPAAYIEELRIDSLIGEAAKEREQPCPLGINVSLARAKDHVELPVRTRFKIEPVIGEDVQTARSRFRVLQFAKVERRGGGDGEGAIQQRRRDARRRFGPHLYDLRFGNSVPIFQRRLDVALKEIDAGQKVVRISVRRVEPQRRQQMAGRLRIILLSEADAGQFKIESLVPGLLTKPDPKCPLGFIPTSQSGQSRTVVVIDVSGALGVVLRNPNDLLPSFFREELFDFSGVSGEGRLRPEGKRRKGEHEKYGRRFHFASD